MKIWKEIILISVLVLFIEGVIFLYEKGMEPQTQWSSIIPLITTPYDFLGERTMVVGYGVYGGGSLDVYLNEINAKMYDNSFVTVHSPLLDFTDKEKNNCINNYIEVYGTWDIIDVLGIPGFVEIESIRVYDPETNTYTDGNCLRSRPK